MTGMHHLDRAELLAALQAVERDSRHAPDLRERTMEIGRTLDDEVRRGEVPSQELALLHLLSLVVRGVLLSKMDKLPQAQSWLEEAISTYPNQTRSDPLVFSYLGWALLLQGQHPEAIAAFTTSISIEDRAPAPFLGRAIALKRLGESRRALADLDVVLRYEPDNAVALRTRREISAT